MTWTDCGKEQATHSDRPDTGSRLGLALLLLAITAPGDADLFLHALGSGDQLHCLQLRETRLDCDDRLLRPAPVRPVSARVGGVALPDPIATPRAEPSGSSALFILVDSNDTARRPAVENSIEHKVWLWYVLLPGGLLVALALILLLGVKKSRVEKSDLASTGPSMAARSLAFLESLDGDGQRHAVTRTAFRIGRHSDNDLSIRDASVSRQHAEIHCKRDGSFTISDLDSMNGVFVNHKKIDSAPLFDGDVVEIGDRSFRFRM